MGKNTIKDEAIKLAHEHCEYDPLTNRIIFFHACNENIVRLLEVSEEAQPAGYVFPMTFAPDIKEGMQYPCAIIVVAQEDYEKIKQGEIELPKDWGNLEDGEEIYKKAV